jgi:pimeloyl-ACP methyl ester carboxylesterase
MKDAAPSRGEAVYRAAEMRLWNAYGATPTEHRVLLARNAVDVRIQQFGSGKPVVFIHGANTSGSSWVALAAQLGGFRCLLVDRPGTGLSGRLTGEVDAGRVERLGDTFVGDLLDGLGIDRAHVIATSLGGYLAFRSAAAEPARVDRMVQFSWPVGAPTTWVPILMRIAAIPGLGRLVASLPASERSIRMTFRQIGHGASLADGRITATDLGAYLALLRHTSTLREDQRLARVLVSALRGLGQASLPESLLRSVHTPTHFVWGEHDPFGGAAVAKRLVELLPRASLEIVPGAGHAPWLDALDHCAEAVRAHLVA